MSFKILCIFLCAFTLTASAQEVLKNPTDSIPSASKLSFSTIEGVVIDSAAAEPVPFASIALYNSETGQMAGGTVADASGKFIIGRVTPGKYRVAISYVGFQTQNIIPLTINETPQKIDLNTIKLRSTDQKLKEVVVTEQRSLIEEKVDRTIYNAEFDATNKGGDATDVLRKAPMLSVDMDGNVSMRGSQNVRILINNKPTTMAANSIADALKMIPADLIQSVEVITSPSAKYDAEGSAGIINIVLKENKLQGFSIGIDGSVGIRGSSLGLNGNYRKNKMAFSLGGMGRFRYNTPGSFSNDQTTIATNGTETQTKQSANSQNQMGGGNYSLGWEYEINKSNSLNASLKYGFRNNVVDQNHLLTENFINGTLINQSLRNVNSTNLSGTWDASVGYTHAFAKKQEELSILALYSRNDLTNNFFNTIIGVGNPDSVISRLKNINIGYNQESTIQVDYQTPISTNQLLEVGVKNILRNVSSDYKFYTARGANSEYITSQGTNLSNVFSYDQNITAAYTSYTISLPKG
ncbi:MAG: outer membrane beta-barrel protein, partial [Cytophagales bacterium]|nr:outer membrane beta-barrel protein [Cytophagales bacterium]